MEEPRRNLLVEDEDSGELFPVFAFDQAGDLRPHEAMSRLLEILDFQLSRAVADRVRECAHLSEDCADQGRRAPRRTQAWIFSNSRGNDTGLFSLLHLKT
jgi:hypothetical protein